MTLYFGQETPAVVESLKIFRSSIFEVEEIIGTIAYDDKENIQNVVMEYDGEILDYKVYLTGKGKKLYKALAEKRGIYAPENPEYVNIFVTNEAVIEHVLTNLNSC